MKKFFILITVLTIGSLQSKAMDYAYHFDAHGYNSSESLAPTVSNFYILDYMDYPTEDPSNYTNSEFYNFGNYGEDWNE